MKTFVKALLSVAVLMMGVILSAETKYTDPPTTTTQPAGEAVNGLTLSISAATTDLKMTPIERDKSRPGDPDYSVEPTKLTFTFTNVSDKPIKLDTYDVGWSHLQIDVTGPDAQSVRIENRKPFIERKMRHPEEKDYPTIEAGKSLTLSWQPKFPGDIASTIYTLMTPGEYKMKVTYSHPEVPAANGKTLAEGSWTGTIASNEIVLNLAALKTPAEPVK